MNRIRRLSTFLFVALVSQCFLVGPLAIAGGDTQVAKKISLTDPVFPEEPKRQHELVVYQDAKGFPSGYAVNLINKVCLDGKCKVVEATLYWDAMGFYERLEYPKGRPLTKREHTPFTAADYERLDRILKDRESILNNHSLAYLAKAAEDDSDLKDVDGVSRATPDTVKQAVVADAAWTSWVLWKYANTEIVPILREETEAHCTPAYIKYMLASNDWRRIEFVLKYLVKQDNVPSQYTGMVVQVLPAANMDQFELALRYLGRAINDKQKLYRHLIRALPSLRGYNAAKVIDTLASDEELENEILVYLTDHLDKLSFYPIHLSLRLIKEREFFSKDAEANVAKLLDNDDFFVARRASEFLAEQQLSPATQQKLKSFRDKYAERL